MPTFAPNLSLLFTEVPFLERFALARESGFTAVEFQFPYAWELADVADALTEHDLDLALFNLPAGDWEAGDRGIAAIWERREEFLAGLEQAIAWAHVLRPGRLNCLVGQANPTAENDLALLQNVRIAAERLAEEELQLTIEPVNSHDAPNFALPTARAARDVIAEIDADNLTLQLDIYHAVRMGEDPVALIPTVADVLGHVQMADVPGRHEPLTGDVDMRGVLAALEAVGYRGMIGLEYIPATTTEAGLAMLRERGFLD